MNLWLCKSEPDVFSIDDLRNQGPEGELWDGVRNYQARNFLQAMRPGDLVLFYHSNCALPGIYGEMRVIASAEPDPTQFDPQSKYFDPKSSPSKPRWFAPRMQYHRHWPQPLPLAAMRADPALADWPLVARGNRLSVLPVSPSHWQHLCRWVAQTGGIDPI